jgi:hypothetical protein
MLSNENPVPGRDCGDCTICCEYLKVDIPELQKPAGTLCPNCKMNKGCAIYETRPQLCRDWLCGWRVAKAFGDEWRPDRSGVLVEFDDDEVPQGFEHPTVKFMLLKMSSVDWPPLVSTIASLINQGKPVYLAIGVANSLQGQKTFLSNAPPMRAAVAARDYAGVVGQLQQALQVLVRTRAADAAAQKSR